MKGNTTRSVSLVAMTAMVAALAPAISTAGAAYPAASPPEPARELRSIYTSEYGVSRPSGVTYDTASDALLVAGPTAAGGTKFVELTPTEDRLGAVARPGLEDAGDAAFDPHRQQLVTQDPDALAQVGDARGSTYSPDGTRHVLDAASGSIVSVRPDGSTHSTQLDGLDSGSLDGIAYNPDDSRLYVADSSTLYAVSAAGDVQRSYDIGDAGIADMQAMTFAPSADPTDDAADQSLYVADAGDQDTLGRIAEITLEPMALVAANETATVVATHDVGTGIQPAGSPSSPDPSGITFIPGSNRLLVSDGEVDEITALYQNVNLYGFTRAGAYVNGGTSLPESNEPTGVAFNPANGSMLTTDDDKKSIFITAAPGGDGVFGTADDPAPTSFKTSSFGNTDPEGIEVDTKRNHLLMADGVGMEVFRLQPGPNGQFQGVGAGTDDVASQFDLQEYGAEDPEGIAYDAARDTIVVVDGSTDSIYELDVNGSLLNVIDISAANSQKAAGIVLAPASDGSGTMNYYVVDRGLDNNSHPGENDGVIYELSADLAPITNFPPFANAGVDQMIDVPDVAHLEAAATDDGPVGALTYRWSKASGPATGTVTFATPNQAITTATFSHPGQYVLRVTVGDGELTDIDDVVVDVYEPGAVRTTTIPIRTGSDDALEGGGSTGDFVDLASADVEMGHDGTPADNPDKILTGLRFSGLPVLPGSEIVSAKIQFKVDEAGSEPASYVIKAEAHANAPTYVSTKGSISARTMGTASVPWSPPAWPAPVAGVGGLAGPDQLTPELKTLVQEVVNRPGWVKGNAVNFTIGSATGERTGRRTAEAKDGLTPAMLVLQFRQPVAEVTKLTLRSSKSSLVTPGKLRLTGRMTEMTNGTALAGRAVKVYATRSPSTRRRLVGTVQTAANGTFAFVDAPRVSTRYVVSDGTSWSPVARVTVRPRLTARLSPSNQRVNAPARISGVVSPVAAKLPVLLQRRKGTSWVTVQRRTLAAGAQRGYTFSVRHKASGTFRYRVFVPARAGRASTKAPGNAGGLALRVFRTDIVRVKPAGAEFVTLRNTGRVTVNLQAWRLRNAANGREVRLPAKQLKPGAIVRVHTGRGRSGPRDIYLGKRPMWGAQGTAILRSNRLVRVDRFSYRS